MRIRVLYAIGAAALVAASCAQPEPQVLSEAPRSASATEDTSPTSTTEEEQPGRFIARCATEADGGTPGMTIFTDGTQNVTDHCLSRYYIGVQPAPGALYVPDEEAGTYAPPSETTQAPTTEAQWTPAQPRTDIGEDGDLLEETQATDDPDATDTDEPGTEDPDTSETPTDGSSPTSPTTPPTTDPGGTEPGQTEPGQSEPGESEPTSPGESTPDTSTPGTTEPGQTGPAGPGSSDPTSVPTVTETRQQPGPLTSVTSSSPSAPSGSAGSQGSTGAQQPTGSQGSAGSDVPPGPESSVGLPSFRWPGSFWPGGPQN